MVTEHPNTTGLINAANENYKNIINTLNMKSTSAQVGIVSGSRWESAFTKISLMPEVKWANGLSRSLNSTGAMKSLPKIAAGAIILPNDQLSHTLKLMGVSGLQKSALQSIKAMEHNSVWNKFGVKSGLSGALQSVVNDKAKVFQTTFASPTLSKIAARQLGQLHIADQMGIVATNSALLRGATLQPTLNKILSNLNTEQTDKLNNAFNEFTENLPEDDANSETTIDKQVAKEVAESFKTGNISKLSHKGRIFFQQILLLLLPLLIEPILGATPIGQSINQWLQVDLGNYTDLVIEGNGINPKQPKHAYRTVRVDGLTLRNRPKQHAKIINVLGEGTVVKVVQTKRHWKRVVVADANGTQIFGWTNTTYLKVIKTY
ncbi:hypothetical protein AYR54_09945 [Loigolactobacillus backii]|uniref:SH3 domain-containing protein n=1 Tax=Loigolactobacillus TaxID=2767889 RepID=UPI0007F0B0C8|nr:MULTISPECIES: SH3 domain-containing protein [Loigolactobacillus]ANK60576.1 hypothetical protein AYR52_10140 [Loigolactobacillus backii]ANK65529.1 hypothetical protein AYR54_09945 [Loigolactobacillus backii]ANK68000.1 hypothetical protein AYR55_10065 [Loigolactobacillus backii]OLF69523.1 hypothetical protein ACX53_07555 [Loigolactobacillus backii]